MQLTPPPLQSLAIARLFFFAILYQCTAELLSSHLACPGRSSVAVRTGANQCKTSQKCCFLAISAALHRCEPVQALFFRHPLPVHHTDAIVASGRSWTV